jgi:hypothetical protein
MTPENIAARTRRIGWSGASGSMPSNADMIRLT